MPVPSLESAQRVVKVLIKPEPGMAQFQDGKASRLSKVFTVSLAVSSYVFPSLV